MSDKEKKAKPKRKPDSSKGGDEKKKKKKPKGEKKAPTAESMAVKIVNVITSDPAVSVSNPEELKLIKKRFRAKVVPLLMDFEAEVRKKG
jgi:hypothetical protein